MFSFCKKFEHIIQIGKYKDIRSEQQDTNGVPTGGGNLDAPTNFCEIQNPVCVLIGRIHKYFCEIQIKIRFAFSLAGENASKGPQNAVKWPYQGQVAVPDGRYKTTDHDKSEIGSKLFGKIKSWNTLV